MSRRDEDRILHGLHYYRESIDEEFSVTCDQILWLAAHSYIEGTGWFKGDDLQSFDSTVVPIEFRRKLLMSKFELPLRYLHYRRLIKLTRSGEDMVNVAVTFAGADRPCGCTPGWGEWKSGYQKHRDGFLGLVTTIAVSLITALATVYVMEHLHAGKDDPPRLIYEVEPKPQPGA